MLQEASISLWDTASSRDAVVDRSIPAANLRCVGQGLSPSTLGDIVHQLELRRWQASALDSRRKINTRSREYQV